MWLDELCSTACVYRSMASLKWFSWNFLLACVLSSSDLASCSQKPDVRARTRAAPCDIQQKEPSASSSPRHPPPSCTSHPNCHNPPNSGARTPRARTRTMHGVYDIGFSRTALARGNLARGRQIYRTCSGEGGERGELAIVTSSLASESDFSLMAARVPHGLRGAAKVPDFDRGFPLGFPPHQHPCYL